MSITVQQDSLHDDLMPPKLGTTLNILTILTIIGCVLALLSAIWNYVGIDTQYAEKGKYAEQYAKSPAAARNFMPAPAEFEEMITISYENKIVLTVLGILAVVLCFAGALQMRKLKKSGYWLWLTGEILPLIYSFVFFGAGFLGGLGLILSAVIPALFIILYSFQKKNLVY